jgi:hypothetical protein
VLGREPRHTADYGLGEGMRAPGGVHGGTT